MPEVVFSQAVHAYNKACKSHNAMQKQLQVDNLQFQKLVTKNLNKIISHEQSNTVALNGNISPYISSALKDLRNKLKTHETTVQNLAVNKSSTLDLVTSATAVKQALSQIVELRKTITKSLEEIINMQI